MGGRGSGRREGDGGGRNTEMDRDTVGGSGREREGGRLREERERWGRGESGMGI